MEQAMIDRLRQLDKFLDLPCCPQCHGIGVSMSSVKQGVKSYLGQCGHRYQAEGNTVRANRTLLNYDGSIYHDTLGERLVAASTLTEIKDMGVEEVGLDWDVVERRLR
jgi:hypothetical protein